MLTASLGSLAENYYGRKVEIKNGTFPVAVAIKWKDLRVRVRSKVEKAYPERGLSEAKRQF